MTQKQLANHPVAERLRNEGSFISYGHQSVDEKDIQAVTDVLKSPFLTTGPVAGEFEKDLCRLTGAKHAIVCANGTAALHLACLGLGIRKGDLGITSPITFLASANCMEFCGGKVDFVDIDPETLCLSPERLREYCKKGDIPKVVIPVDFAGIPADLPELSLLSREFGFHIIEDAAHSIGSSYQYEGKEFACGSCAHSDAATFSFHPVKTITAGEGGAVLTNDDALADRIRKMRSHGVERRSDWMRKNDGPWYYEMAELSYNFRITDFQCALARSQLTKLKAFAERRLEIVNRYNHAFRGMPGLIAPPMPENTSICYHLYPLQFKDGEKKRYHAFQELWEQKIYCQIHYIPVHHQPYYQDKYHYAVGKCPESETYYSRCLSLPLYPALKDDEVDFIIEAILAYMA